MIETVTQDTLRVLLPSKVALAAELPRFYASRTYRELENEKSKYWWFSPVDLCDLSMEESTP